MSGKPWAKTLIDNQRVWDSWWKHFKEEGEKAKDMYRSHFARLVADEIGYDPKTVIRKMNYMIKHKPTPCY